MLSAIFPGSRTSSLVEGGTLVNVFSGVVESSRDNYSVVFHKYKQWFVSIGHVSGDVKRKRSMRDYSWCCSRPVVVLATCSTLHIKISGLVAVETPNYRLAINQSINQLRVHRLFGGHHSKS